MQLGSLFNIKIYEIQ